MRAREKIVAELVEAERALAASQRALSTHGHRSITWMLYRYDAARVSRLRKEAERSAISAKEAA